MDEKGKWLNGLADAMKVAGNIGPTQLANLVGTSKQNIDRWADQSRKLPLDFAEKIAKALNRAPAEIYMPKDARVGFERVRHITWISAGKLAHHEPADGDIGHVLIGGLPAGEWVALTVDGDSMDRISPPESIILVNLRDKKLVPNACYVIEDEEGNTTYKRYRANPIRFEPVSTNKDLEPLYPKKPLKIIGRVRRSILQM